MNNRRRGSQWQGYVGQHMDDWQQRGNRSIFDRLEQGPSTYNSSVPHLPRHNRLRSNYGFDEHNNDGSVFDRLVRPPKLNKNSRKRANQMSNLSKGLQWRMRKNSKNERAGNEVVVTGSALDAITALSNAPADTTDWDAIIQEALDGVKITRDEIDQKELVLGLIEETLKAKFPRAICRLFGSSETGLGFKDSDADIYVSLGHDPYSTTTKKEGKAKAAKLTRQLGFCFKRHDELRVASMIPHCRVPLVKLYHKPSKTRVDLSFRSAFGVSNSSLVRLLCQSHPQVLPFMLFLRLWATAHNISGPGRPSNLLTNYTLSLLALFTCTVREQKLVPSLEDLRKQPFHSNTMDGWECGYGTDVTAFWQQQEKEPPTSVEGGVLALALEFFELFAGLDYLRWAVCPLVGSLVDRQTLQAAADAAPAVDTEDVDSDWGETEDVASADTDNVNDDTAMITDDGSADMMTGIEETDAANNTDAVATDAADNTDAVATDAANNTDAVATDAANNTDAVAIDTANNTDAVATDAANNTDAVATDAANNTDAVATDAANNTDAVATDAANNTDTVALDAAASTDAVTTDAAALMDMAVTDLVVTTDIVVDDTAIKTGTGANSRVDTNDTGMEVADDVAEDAAVTSVKVTEDINDASTPDQTNAAATAANSITDPAVDGGNNSLPEALLPHIAKMKNMINKKVPLCVIDVYELDNNITSQYRLQNVKSFQKKCRISAKILKEVLTQEKPLSALFSKLEDFQ